MPLAYSLTPSSLCKFNRIDFEENLKRNHVRMRNISSSKRKLNELSPTAKKKLKKSSQNLIFLSKKRNIGVNGKTYCTNFRAAFITLKLPSKQMHDHSTITSQCLNQFLIQIRKYYGVKNYVWKAELQQNGNIHYHLLVDTFVHHMAIRKYWNQAIGKLGYIEDYRSCRASLSLQDYTRWRNQEGFYDKEAIKKAYNYGVETGWKSPNSTDVKFVNNDKKAAAYISKYLSKNENEEKDYNLKKLGLNPSGGIKNDSRKELIGRIWYCSNSLSRLKNLIIPSIKKFNNLFSYLKNSKKTKCISSDFFEIVYFQLGNFGENLNHTIKKLLLTNAYLSSYPFPSKWDDVLTHSFNMSRV